MPLQIPDRDIRRLNLFVQLSQKELDALYRGLSGALPSLSSKEFTESVAKLSGLSISHLTDVIRFLMNLYWVTVDAELSPSETADEVIRNAQESKIEQPKHGWVSFKGYIEKFLSLEKTLGVASKSLFLATQHQCHFHAARIMTDARPVFGSDPTQAPVAFVLSHTLQMDIHTAEDRDKEVFIALDGQDLLALRTTIDRAIAKEKSLREALAVTSVPLLSMSGLDADLE